ncbi:hypothetical protein U9R90_24910 [Streptomyces sp. E11-3]|uniref:hypothetical protein n=1 Tax=Streptomyces sp. E11-3 TaxID=3110112 RepID=UPI0039818F65
MAYDPWQPGLRITANRLLAISPTWQDWTPVWTTSTGANTPSFGDAAIIARYAQTAHVVLWRLQIAFGATTDFGGGGASDNWRFSIPVTSNESQLIAGYGEIQGANSAERFPVRARLTTTTDLELELSGGAYNNMTGNSSGLVDAATPFGAGSSGSTAWGNGFSIRLQGQYETA